MVEIGAFVDRLTVSQVFFTRARYPPAGVSESVERAQPMVISSLGVGWIRDMSIRRVDG